MEGGESGCMGIRWRGDRGWVTEYEGMEEKVNGGEEWVWGGGEGTGG